jgi:hypothetical protein
MTTTTLAATAQAAHWYGLGLAGVWGGVTEGEATTFIDWLNDTIKVALYTTTTINRDTNRYYVTTNEVTGAQYTAGGATIGTKTLAYASNVITFDAANTAWSSGAVASSGTPAYYAVIYDASIGDATHHPLLGYLDFANKAGGLWSSGAVFTIIWPAAGIFTITIS